MDEHIAEPWILTGADDGKGNWTSFEVVEEASGRTVCFLTSDGNNIEQKGRLIAAAPELLSAIKNLADWLAYGLAKTDGAEPTAEDHRTCERLAKAARAAVDKAEGRT